MYFNQFIKKTIGDHSYCYGHRLSIFEDNVYIDGVKSQFKVLDEARQHIKEEYNTRKLEKEVSEHLYETLSYNTIANIIKEYYDVKVTDTLIENYISLASSKIFTIDPIVQQIRKLNKLDSLLENKIHYVLNDESIVAINERTQEFLNNLLQNQTDIIEYMRESKENFFYVLERIEE